uniref:CREWS-C1 n=1 Tax=Colubraria reticulata TaxID=604273 RepID=A0AA96UT42_9CAEN|nr:CREWS-C1 [Colubraria reticulata]
MLLFHLFLLFVILCSSAAQRVLLCDKPTDIRALMDANAEQLLLYTIGLMSDFVQMPTIKDVIKFTDCDADTAIRKASENISDGKQNVIVFITSDSSTVTEKAVQAAEEARSKGILLFAVGVGNDMDNTKLNELAGEATENKQFVFTYKDIDELYLRGYILRKGICKGGDKFELPTPDPCKKESVRRP